jgi:hypothetical protein
MTNLRDDNSVGKWILSQPAPIAIGASLGLSVVTGLVIGGAAVWLLKAFKR